jgi:hypothetical protein
MQDAPLFSPRLDDTASSHGRLTVAIDAAVLDIGLAGLAIEVDTRLATQSAVTLRLAAEEGEVETRGRVVWCFFHGTASARGGEQVPVYRAGIEFTDVLTPLAAGLMRFLERNAVVEGGSRLFGRFRLSGERPATVELDAPFTAVEVRAAEAVIEAPIGIEPPPGCRVRLDPVGAGGDDAPIAGHVAEVARGESSSELRRLTLALEGDDAPRLARALAAAGE